MKLFLKKILRLIVPLFLMGYPLDLMFSYILSQNHDFPGEYEVWNDIYDGKVNSDIVIYGSSRAWVQFDSNLFENLANSKVYNLGIDGHNFRLQYLRHLEYLKRNKQPKNIILNVDVFTLEKRVDLYQQEQFLPYMLWNKNLRDYTSDYEGFSTSDYYIPFLRYIGRNRVLKNVTNRIFIGNSDTTLFRDKGYRGFDKEWGASLDSLLTSNNKYTINFNQPTISLFERFINECMANDIKVTLVYAPEYIDGQRYVTNREKAMTIYRNISQKYDLIFLDYSNDELSFDKQLFYNASHLNKDGAQLFTRKLVEDLAKHKFFDKLNFIIPNPFQWKNN